MFFAMASASSPLRATSPFGTPTPYYIAITGALDKGYGLLVDNGSYSWPILTDLRRLAERYSCMERFLRCD